jgi:hypothetical protein
MSDNPHVHGDGESYSGVVPAKHPNKGGRPPAEGVEERPLTKENMEQSNLCRTPSRESRQSGLDRVREVAKGDGKSDTPRRAGGLMGWAASKAVVPRSRRRAKARLCQ